MNYDTSFDVPWTPVLLGQTLLPFPAYETLVRDNVRPVVPQHTSWARGSVVNYVDSVPEAEAAICEAVLAIWRLEQLSEHSEDGPLWQNYVSAWLVRFPRGFDTELELTLRN